MNEVEWLQSLDRPARVPTIDVTCGVMQTVGTLPRKEDEGVLSIGAGLAVIAGAVAVAAALPFWNVIQDPFAALFEQFRLVLQ